MLVYTALDVVVAIRGTGDEEMVHSAPGASP
jgi:hypothetical protein